MLLFSKIRYYIISLMKTALQLFISTLFCKIYIINKYFLQLKLSMKLLNVSDLHGIFFYLYITKIDYIRVKVIDLL